MTEEHDLFVIARKLRYDLTAMQAKVTDLLNGLAAANLPTPEKLQCPRCGIHLAGPRAQDEHLYLVHDITTDAQAERIAAERMLTEDA